MFNKRIRAELAQLRKENEELRKDNSNLAHIIRQLDQQIFNMAMKTSWEDMRPLFAKLCEETNVRMKLEHNRITSILLPELNRTYGR